MILMLLSHLLASLYLISSPMHRRILERGFPVWNVWFMCTLSAVCHSASWHATWLMRHWDWEEESFQLVSTALPVCAYSPSTSSHTARNYPTFAGPAVQPPQSGRIARTAARFPANYKLRGGLLENTHHSQRRGPKWIKSTVGSAHRKVHGSHSFLSQ